MLAVGRETRHPAIMTSPKFSECCVESGNVAVITAAMSVPWSAMSIPFHVSNMIWRGSQTDFCVYS